MVQTIGILSQFFNIKLAYVNLVVDMSRKLSEYLGVNNIGFLATIRALEASTFSPGIDIKLSLEIENKTNQKESKETKRNQNKSKGMKNNKNIIKQELKKSKGSKQSQKKFKRN